MGQGVHLVTATVLIYSNRKHAEQHHGSRDSLIGWCRCRLQLGMKVPWVHVQPYDLIFLRENQISLLGKPMAVSLLYGFNFHISDYSSSCDNYASCIHNTVQHDATDCVPANTSYGLFLYGLLQKNQPAVMVYM